MNLKYLIANIVSFVAMAQMLVAQVPAGVPWATPNGQITQPGIMGVTCGVLEATPSNDRYTFGLIDVRAANSAPLPLNSSDFANFWYPPMYHHTDWKIDRIGSVFGISHDADGDIYLAASSSYGTSFFGTPGIVRYGDIGGGENDLGAAGTVYKIDRVTGLPTVFVQLPQQETSVIHGGGNNAPVRLTGPGLGDVCYDAAHNQFFVSNFEDGKIYRISSAGVILNSFDPFAADNGAAGFAPQRERVWALQIRNNKIYFSTFLNSFFLSSNSSSSYRDIYSKALTAGGDFDAASPTALEVSINVTSSSTTTTFTDIAFNAAGQMMLAGRPMYADARSGTGDTQLRILTHNGTSWDITNTISPGIYAAGNSSGGADWGYDGVNPEGFVWAAADRLLDRTGTDGAQGWKVANSPVSGQVTMGNMVMIPYLPNGFDAGDGNIHLKGYGGDVEIYSLEPCSIQSIAITPGSCNDNSTAANQADDYYTANVTVNFSNKPATGNLVLSGVALHSSNSVSTVAVASTTSSTSHTYTGVRIKANATANDLTATFSADVACTLTIATTPVANCSVPPLSCLITSVGVTPGVCNDNATPNDSTDDYYTGSVTVNFSNKPATGNLVLSGASLHSTNSVTSIAVGSTTSATSHTFTGVRLLANGAANALTATFSADSACTLTVNAATVANCSTPPAACLITNIRITPGLCNDNGTAANTADDYYEAGVAVSFSGQPATGNLVLSGAALHSSNTVNSVAVGSTNNPGVGHTFANVRLKADGMVNALTATFSADSACTLTVNAPSVPNCSAPPADCTLAVAIPSISPCSTPDCDMTDIVVTPGACNANGTNNNETDDYYTSDVTITFASKPASGNLVLSGVALHSSNTVTTVAVASTTSATTHTFAGVRLKANGVANAITATFSADLACTRTVNAPTINECSAPDCDITDLAVTPGQCNDNGTVADATDDYYTASVTVNFTNKPATGNLDLSGVALHSGNTVTTVAVASTTSATTHTFAGVRIKANGVANAITATFSADLACTMTVNAPTIGSCSGGCPSFPPVADSMTVACNTSVNRQLSTAGGLAPYMYAVTGGALPTGVSLTAGGLLSGDPSVTGTFNVTITVTDANNCTGVINLQIIVSPCYSLGNLVWNDNGAGGGTMNDGMRNGTEPALANVLVELLDNAGTPYNPGSGAVTTTTNASGYYRFDNLPAGNYCVRVAASNFAGAAVLDGFISSGGQSTDFTAAGNNKDHGAPLAGAVLSTKVTLGASNPTGEKDAGATGAGDNGPEGDANDNLAVDFGFFVIPPGCLVSDMVITPSVCNDNGTPADATDDYYTASVTVNFSSKPATGDLVLSGAALHSTNSVTTVAVGSTTSATSHTFAGVKLKANGVVNALTSTFSADAACTLTVDAPNVPNCSTPPCDITDLVVTPGACSDYGTPNNPADDCYTANVTVTFSNKPASGNLVLSGVALHGSNAVGSVLVGSTTSATTHTFVGVKIKANGVANALTATFSADLACTITINAPSVPNCSVPCAITNLAVTPGVCNDNGTPLIDSDDYFTSNVTVTFSNKPATGNLVLSGVALHATNAVTTVAVGATSTTTTHTYVGVKFKANGAANAITATFSADPACTITSNAPSVPECSTPPVLCCPQIILGAP